MFKEHPAHDVHRAADQLDDLHGIGLPRRTLQDAIEPFMEDRELRIHSAGVSVPIRGLTFKPFPSLP